MSWDEQSAFFSLYLRARFSQRTECENVQAGTASQWGSAVGMISLDVDASSLLFFPPPSKNRLGLTPFKMLRIPLFMYHYCIVKDPGFLLASSCKDLWLQDCNTASYHPFGHGDGDKGALLVWCWGRTSVQRIQESKVSLHASNLGAIKLSPGF